ncbi:MAG TPA: type II secretion system protein GspJ [Fimbriimonas sp.]|nr:type II secretion system protein GspJ [Fimbriimonas sp.]
MRTRGLSLLEALLALSMVAITIGAVIQAEIVGVHFEKHFGDTRQAFDSQVAFEDKLTRLISGAQLTDPNAVFQSPIPQSSQGQTDVGGNQSILGPGSASLVMTTWEDPPSVGYLQNQADFETLNQKFGPQGGPAEIGLSMEPVGDDAGFRRGLFLREQKPPDGDPTQGGQESLVQSGLQDIRFEFYDGNQWLTAWDSKNDQKGKLPQIVRITYVLPNDQKPHSLLVPMPLATAPSTSGGNS